MMCEVLNIAKHVIAGAAGWCLADMIIFAVVGDSLTIGALIRWRRKQ